VTRNGRPGRGARARIERIRDVRADVPDSTRRSARENREQLEHADILRRGRSIKIKAYATAVLIPGLLDSEVDRVIDELETDRAVLT